MHMNNVKTELVSIRTSQYIILIDPSEIICCILVGRKVDIFLVSDECIETIHNLKEVEEKLKNNRFLRCHSKFLVNLDHRLKFDAKNREIELINKKKIAVSKNRKAMVTQILKENIN